MNRRKIQSPAFVCVTVKYPFFIAFLYVSIPLFALVSDEYSFPLKIIISPLDANSSKVYLPVSDLETTHFPSRKLAGCSFLTSFFAAGFAAFATGFTVGFAVGFAAGFAADFAQVLPRVSRLRFWRAFLF